MNTTISKLVAILLLFAIATVHTFSQTINLDEVSGCLVSDVSGKVTYTEPGNPMPKPVTAGMVLADDATLYIGKKSSLTLVNDDHSLVVNKKGSHQMVNLAAEVKAKGEVSRFAKMAFAAKGYVDTTRVKKGWGEKDSLIFKFPVNGKIPIQPTKFSWNSLISGSTYKLIIYEKSSDSPLLSVITSDAAFTFDPTQLAIQTGKVYHVQVMLASDMKTTSKVVNITFVSKSELESVLTSILKYQEYRKSNAFNKSLMEASELEFHGLNSSASERYDNAIQLDRNSTLAKQMYAAFRNRVD